MKSLYPLIAAMGLTLAATACASGGGPQMSAADSAQLIATYSGTWILDESSSSPQIPNALEGVEDNQQVEDLASRPGGFREQRYWRRVAARQRDIGAMRETIEVLRERPETLTLQLDATTFTYRPTPGDPMELPMDGSDIDRNEGEYPVDAKLEWEAQFPVIVYTVTRGSSVRELFEAVGDRLIVRRTLAGAGEEGTQVLAYDRRAGN